MTDFGDFGDKVSELANAYDLPGLDALAAGPLDDAQKTVLAEDGYLSIANVMEYDISCGKGGDGAAETFFECVESAEALVGPLWQRKGNAYQALFEEKKDLAFLHLARDAYEKIDAPSHLAYVHKQLAEHEDPLSNWERSVQLVLRDPPDDRGWYLFVTLIYDALPDEEPALSARRLEEQQRFEQAPAFGSFADIQIIRACEDHAVPLAVWLPKACAYRAEDGTREQLREAAHQLAKHEVSLERGAELYRVLLERTESPGLEVYYYAKVLERLGRVDEALGVHAQHVSSFDRTLSPMIHYAELLERALSTAKQPPALELVRSIALAAEVLGEGYYSGPGIVLARLALREGDERQVRFAIERLLLLHEVCIDDVLETLRADVTLPATRAFLDETLQFIEDVKVGYYLNPCIRWAELKALSPDEVHARWTSRMAEIRARPARES